MTMADFDSLFADNLRDFQPVMMQAQYSGSRDTMGRARSSGGNMERTDSGSPNYFQPSLTPPLSRRSQTRGGSASIHSHRRQHSAGAASAVNISGQDSFGEMSMNDLYNGSPNGSPSPAEGSSIPLQTDQLLSFRTFHRNNILLLDAMGAPVNMDMAAQLHGMFFLAESPWDSAGVSTQAGATHTPKELTCYRRNLFQVTGSISLPHVQEVIVGEGEGEQTIDKLATAPRRYIHSLEAAISGIENVDHSPVKIISVPWKNAATAAATTAAATGTLAAHQNVTQSQPTGAGDDYPPTANATGRPVEKEPAPLLFNYPPAYYLNPNGIPPEEIDANNFKWQMNWKRLQFRSATANNGRRKDLQQHFMVKLSIYATLIPEGGVAAPTDKLERVLLCEAFSNSIIVRGRSPRNFSSRNDIPLTGSAMVSSRHMHNNNANAQNMASAAKKARHMSTGSNEEESKPDMMYSQEIASQYSSTDYLLEQQGSLPQMPNEMNFPTEIYAQQGGWVNPQEMAILNEHFFGPNEAYANLTSSNASRVNISGLMYPNGYPAQQPQTIYNQLPPVTTMGSSMPPPSITRGPHPNIQQPRAVNEGSPSMDLLYEYFPIGVDDYMPPVEVVYRPHNAHHQTQLPPNKTSTRSKRLFSETPFE
ncbi:hypothetical protein TWF694_004135 [Orbilia ellipsospora]|uniref:NDT80 domain-containing protein n=1 Tax=Orbilia ellipsospora TaxID=2528407 RepID=A0AAV9WZM8_9PEZI